MKSLKTVTRLVLTLALLFAFHQQAQAQSMVTNADVQRMQDNIYDASRDISQLRARDAGLAAQLQTELDDLSDEAIYYRVKLRKNESITRNEFSAFRDRVENIRTRARGDAGAGRRTAESMDVPVGTEFDVRLQQSLSSSTAQVEDRFHVTTLVDLREGDRVIVPAGSTMRGIVSSVNKAGRVDRKGSMTVTFDQLTIKGRTYPIQATVTEAIESEGIKAEAGRIGAGAGVGAIIGGILGGFKGAMAGILIGGGGTIAATEGTDVTLPAGSVLRVRLDSGLNLR